MVQTLKSLSSLALLAVSQLCTTQSRESSRFVGRVIPEPYRLDEPAPLRRGHLPVLARDRRNEVSGELFADPRDKPGDAADLLKGRQRLALGVQCLAAPPGTRVPAELSIERVGPLRVESRPSPPSSSPSGGSPGRRLLSQAPTAIDSRSILRHIARVRQAV